MRSTPRPNPRAPTSADFDALISLFNTRRYAELESNVTLLLKKYPDASFAWQLLGGSLQMQGKNSLTAFQKAAELSPQDPTAHFNLGVALKSSGQAELAANSYRQAVALKPDYVEAYNNLGGTLKDLGQLDSAITCYLHAIRIQPHVALTHNNLGTIFKDIGDINAAIASYRKALDIQPNYAEAYSNIGNAQKQLGDYDSALKSYRKALEIKPDYAEVYSNIGSLFKETEQSDESSKSYLKALEISPVCDSAMLGLADLCAIDGKMQESEAWVKKILSVNPNNFEARFLLARTKKSRTEDENLAALLSIAISAKRGEIQIAHQSLISLNFSLGKCLDDLGEYDRAFAYFLEGCKLKRATFKYDHVQMSKHVDAVINTFSSTTLQRLRGSSNTSNVPIFVLGMPRSGTTLTEQIIASHPNVYGAGELPNLQRIIQREVAGVKNFPDNIIPLDHSTLIKWANDYVAELCQRAPNARHITDKMPSNFWGIGLIHVMLPNAKIILVNRNPVDTCLSCFTKLFSGSLEYSYDLTELGQYYVGYARLMDHWRAVLPAGTILEVQYEDVVENQEAQARRIINFCDLSWDNACIDFYKNQRSVGTASLAQVRQPIYRSSIERWRSYEKHLTPLLDALGDLVS